MLGVLLLEVLEPVPCLVIGLFISRTEGGDVGPQLYSFFRQEVFTEERS